MKLETYFVAAVAFVAGLCFGPVMWDLITGGRGRLRRFALPDLDDRVQAGPPPRPVSAVSTPALAVSLIAALFLLALASVQYQHKVRIAELAHAQLNLAEAILNRVDLLDRQVDFLDGERTQLLKEAIFCRRRLDSDAEEMRLLWQDLFQMKAACPCLAPPERKDP